MRLRDRLARRLASRLLPALVPLALASVAFSTPPSAPPVTYDPNPNALVVGLREVLGEVADADPGPTIEVFGDGRVAVHRPHYMIGAGDWTDRLAPRELRQLIRDLVDDGFLTLDHASAQATLARARATRHAAARSGGATVFEASDPSTMTIQLHANGRRQTIVWRGLHADAYAHPDVADVQVVQRAHARVRTLFARPGLQRVP
jgi:hypothetical protein